MKKVTAFAAVLLMLCITACSEQKAAEPVSTSSTGSTDSDIYSSASVEATPAKEGNISLTVAVSRPNAEFASNDRSLFDKVVEKFNSEDNGYTVELIDYSQDFDFSNSTEEDYAAYREGLAAQQMRLNMDIMDGETIDIIDESAFTGGGFERFMKMGAFADLYPFMAEDSEINTETLDSHILSLFENEQGELCCLPLFYSVETLAGYTEYVGDKENWSVDECIEHWNNMPEGALFGGHNRRDYVYFDLLRGNMESYIDYSNYKVHFDSPEFLKLLEFIGTFPLSEDFKPDDEFDTARFIHWSPLYGFGTKLDGMTLVGYPTENGSGAFVDAGGYRMAVSSQISDEKKQGAWLFIREFASYEYQYEYSTKDDYLDTNNFWTAHCESGGFPINKEMFRKNMEFASEHEGETVKLSRSGVECEEECISMADCEKLAEYIGRVDRASSDMEEDLWNIINDEMLKYCAGASSAQETADMIQNRATLWIEEKQW